MVILFFPFFYALVEFTFCKLSKIDLFVTGQNIMVSFLKRHFKEKLKNHFKKVVFSEKYFYCDINFLYLTGDVLFESGI